MLGVQAVVGRLARDGVLVARQGPIPLTVQGKRRLIVQTPITHHILARLNLDVNPIFPPLCNGQSLTNVRLSCRKFCSLLIKKENYIVL